MATEKIVTPTFRLSFPQVWTPKSFEKGPAQFSATALFDKAAQETPEFKRMLEIATEAKVEKFGENYAAPLRNPFRKGDEKVRKEPNPDGSVAYMDGYGPGIIFVRFSSGEEYAPSVLDANKDEILDKKTLYAGCYCRAVVQALGYDKGGNRGVKFGFSLIQKLEDGDAFGGGGSGVELLDDLPQAAVGTETVPAPAPTVDDDFLGALK